MGVTDERAADDHAVPAGPPPTGHRRIGTWSVDDVSGLAGLRTAVRDAVRGRTSPVDGPTTGLADLAMLLVSELATNALRHGTAPTLVTLARDGTSFLLDVADHDTTTRPVVAGARAPGEGGFGLMIARQVATEVGWYVASGTKHVWARLDA